MAARHRCAYTGTPLIKASSMSERTGSYYPYRATSEPYYAAANAVTLEPEVPPALALPPSTPHVLSPPNRPPQEAPPIPPAPSYAAATAASCHISASPLHILTVDPPPPPSAPSPSITACSCHKHNRDCHQPLPLLQFNPPPLFPHPTSVWIEGSLSSLVYRIRVDDGSIVPHGTSPRPPRTMLSPPPRCCLAHRWRLPRLIPTASDRRRPPPASPSTKCHQRFRVLSPRSRPPLQFAAGPPCQLWAEFQSKADRASVAKNLAEAQESLAHC
ncbi:hypothetical protein Salat_1898300 [Sesamum alatum]|uniref:Uncharacterized protein n=1 Tax=Sesamum alatum TaxID=300844 RepID=A0AAE2CIA4_9LAMI|nr:hypothetical protein Salat_1898300 [Sesamum alatum]